MRVFLIVALCFLLSSCNERTLDFDDVVHSQVYTEEAFKLKGFVTATSSKQDDVVKFRIMVKDHVTKEDAKALVQDFIDTMETQIHDKELFIKSYRLTFDLKSEKDGEILFQGKRDKGTRDLWWQF